MIAEKKLTSSELLFNSALRMKLTPRWIDQGGLFVISTDQGERYVYGVHGAINNQLSGGIARNKAATRLVLERNGFPSIPFLRPANSTEAEQFLAVHGTIIVKPLTGSNSRGVSIVRQASELSGIETRGVILEKYIAGREFRYLILSGTVIAVHESDYGVSVEESRPLKRISYPRETWDEALVTLSLQTANALGLRYAAVDYLITAQGEACILEVNSAPGMKWFHAPSSGPAVDVAGLFLEEMLGNSTDPGRYEHTLLTSAI